MAEARGGQGRLGAMASSRKWQCINNCQTTFHPQHHHPPSRRTPHPVSEFRDTVIMDAFSLKTASTYINNLLLARGLLRDGEPISFARPAKVEGGADTTMARVINLVHDLILKRDVCSSWSPSCLTLWCCSTC
jgi:hypothetical protein